MKFGVFFCWVMISAAQAGNGLFVRSPLAPPAAGPDPDAAGSVICSFSGRKSQVLVQASRLNASTEYQILVDGVVEGVLQTNAKGIGKARFLAPVRNGAEVLDFDPRGKVLQVSVGGTAVLSAVISGVGEPVGTVVREQVNLTSVGVAVPGSKASAIYKLDQNGNRSFAVELTGEGDSSHDLYLNGTKIGSFNPAGRVSRIQFETDSTAIGVLPLDFDPRKGVLQVYRTGLTNGVAFTSTMAAVSVGVNVAVPRRITLLLDFADGNTTGTALAKFSISSNAAKYFSVEVSGVPVGSYDLLVGGTVAGSIDVTDSGSGPTGRIDFTTEVAAGGLLPLLLEPTGKTITVQQAGTKFFEKLFPGQPGLGFGKPAPEPDFALQEDLSTTGYAPDFAAAAHYAVEGGRHRFEVSASFEVKANSPPLRYSIFVAGRERAKLNLVLGSDGFARGMIAFDTKRVAGTLPLNFDPRGQLVEVRLKRATYFSHFLGSGSSSSAGSLAGFPSQQVVPLVGENGTASTKAIVRLQDDGDGSAAVVVYLHDAEPGTYRFDVNGQEFGTFDVPVPSSGIGSLGDDYIQVAQDLYVSYFTMPAYGASLFGPSATPSLEPAEELNVELFRPEQPLDILSAILPLYPTL